MLRGNLTIAVALTAGLVSTGAFAQDVKIGLVLPLTGGLAPVGKQVQWGVNLYTKRNGLTVAGKKIEVIIKDDAGVPDKTDDVKPGDAAAKPIDKKPLYALAVEIYNPNDTSTTYLTTFDSLDIAGIDLKKARELPGGAPRLTAHGRGRPRAAATRITARA